MHISKLLRGLAVAACVATGAGVYANAAAEAGDFRLVYLPSKDKNYVCLTKPEAEVTLGAFKDAYSNAQRPHTAKVARSLGGDLSDSWTSGCAMIEARFVPAMPLDVITHEEAEAGWGSGQEHVFVEALIRTYDTGREDWIDRGRGYVLLSTKVVARK